MAVRAPWKGWLRIAMPVVLGLILLNVFIVFLLAIVNIAGLQLFYDDTPAYVQAHSLAIRINLLFFWCMLPLFLLIATIAEYWSLWTDRLSPAWLLISSTTAIVLWIVQLALWLPCISGIGQDSAPAYCPYVYQHGGWGRYPSWAANSPRGAAYAVPTLAILYSVQIGFAAHTFRRQQRNSFRKSDLQHHPWVRTLEEGESYAHLVPKSEWQHDQNRQQQQCQATEPFPSLQETGQLLLSPDNLSVSDYSGSHRPRTPSRSTISAGWLQPLGQVAAPPPPPAHAQRSRRSTSSSSNYWTDGPPLSGQSSYRSRSSSLGRRYYSDYSISQISESEQNYAAPAQRLSEDRPATERRSSSGMRDLHLVRTWDALGQRTRDTLHSHGHGRGSGSGSVSGSGNGNSNGRSG